MRRSRSCALGLFLAACGGEDGGQPPSCPNTGLEEGDQLTSYGGVAAYVHLPAGADCAPLVVYLHGSNGAGTWDGSKWSEPNPTNLAASAEDLGFVLAVPGVTTDKDDHDWHMDDDSAAEIDSVLQGVEAQAPVDPAHAFVIGLSKGAAMATWYGLNDPATAHGIASVAGGYPFGYPEEEPDPKLPFYIAHDPRDPEVPYAEAEALAKDLDAHGHAYLFEDWKLGEDGHGWNPDLPEPILAFLMDPASGGG
jgi:poly(3-hydroxybutyrate) depolymerase